MKFRGENYTSKFNEKSMLGTFPTKQYVIEQWDVESTKDLKKQTKSEEITEKIWEWKRNRPTIQLK